MDKYAGKLAQEAMQHLPLLRNKLGHVHRGLDPVNRMWLLQKIKREKVHRRRVQLSHDGLVPLDSAWARQEAYLDCVLHCRSLQQAVAKQHVQLSISFDPGQYGGKDINAAVAYSPRINKACYMLNQTMGKVMLSDIADDLVKSAQSRRLTRLEGYNELRTLAACLDHSVGIKLEQFSVPSGLIARPLKPQEVRVKSKEAGKYIIYNTQTKEATHEVDPSLCLANTPVLVTISDQGPANVAFLNFLLHCEASSIMLHCEYDCYHRCWNDIKLAAKRSLRKGWKCILHFTCLLDVNFGPFGSGGWFYQKRALLEQFMASTDLNSEVWMQYAKKEGLLSPRMRVAG